MLKVKLVEVDFEFISNISFFGIEEFEKSGLYKVFLGSRNIVEDIEYIGESNELEYKDKDELIKENIDLFTTGNNLNSRIGKIENLKASIVK